MAATKLDPTQQRKKEVVELLIRGSDPKEVAKEHELDQDTLFHWLLWYVQAYYSEAEQTIVYDDWYADRQAELYSEVAVADAQRARRRAGGEMRAKQKQAEAESSYWRFLRIELKGDADALNDRELPIRLQLNGWDKLPENCQRELEWIKRFVRRLRLYKNIIDDEVQKNPKIKNPELVKRIHSREQEVPKTLRRDVAWIEALVNTLRPELAND